MPNYNGWGATNTATDCTITTNITDDVIWVHLGQDDLYHLGKKPPEKANEFAGNPMGKFAEQCTK